MERTTTLQAAPVRGFDTAPRGAYSATACRSLSRLAQQTISKGR
ncbi:MAG: hypothetical protein N2050_03065 [Flavobacteriales bacterium]|nr:hypothetical protein [Flavobacteriales bacterium]